MLPHFSPFSLIKQLHSLKHGSHTWGKSHSSIGNPCPWTVAPGPQIILSHDLTILTFWPEDLLGQEWMVIRKLVDFFLLCLVYYVVFMFRIVWSAWFWLWNIQSRPSNEQFGSIIWYQVIGHLNKSDKCFSLSFSHCKTQPGVWYVINCHCSFGTNDIWDIVLPQIHVWGISAADGGFSVLRERFRHF